MSEHPIDPVATEAVARLARRLAVALSGLQVTGATDALVELVTDPLRSALDRVDQVRAERGNVLYAGTGGANLSGLVEDLIHDALHRGTVVNVTHSVESAIDLISDGDHTDAQVVLRDVVHTLKNLTDEE